MRDSTSSFPRLGVNIDHIATLRQLRGTPYPDVVAAGLVCEQAGAAQITVHLREDRRHIQDRDVLGLKEKLSIPLNLEMALSDKILKFALKVKPAWVCIVPERRQEVTTEGGLDVAKFQKKLNSTIAKLHRAKIKVSLFIEADVKVVALSKKCGADAIEIHTGKFCMASQGAFGKKSKLVYERELVRIEKAGRCAHELGLSVHAGHGFDLSNVEPVLRLTLESGREILPLYTEYNIGHFLVCRATEIGIAAAVKEMKSKIESPWKSEARRR